MPKTNSSNYCRKLALVLLCGFAASGIFARGGKAESKPPTKLGAAFCACCPNHGMWEQQSRILHDFQIEGLTQLNFGQKAYLYMTVASPDDIKGFTLSEDDENGIGLMTSLTARRWTLTLKAKNGETGKLILTLPNSATFFSTDVTPGPKTWAAPGSVYKEIRLEGAVQGTGVFDKSLIAGTKYRLVLQGKGGTCFDPEEFHRWNLKVSGAKADFALFGFFSKAKQ